MVHWWILGAGFPIDTGDHGGCWYGHSNAFRWASNLAKFYLDWGPDLCESRWRAHSLIGVSFECPYQHPPWSPVSIGKPAPKIHQWTIYFCRWGFGWVDKAQCFRSARRFGAAGSSPGFSRGFSRHGAPGPLSWTFFLCEEMLTEITRSDCVSTSILSCVKNRNQ